MESTASVNLNLNRLATIIGYHDYPAPEETKAKGLIDKISLVKNTGDSFDFGKSGEVYKCISRSAARNIKKYLATVHNLANDERENKEGRLTQKIKSNIEVSALLGSSQKTEFKVR